MTMKPSLEERLQREAADLPGHRFTLDEVVRLGRRRRSVQRATVWLGLTAALVALVGVTSWFLAPQTGAPQTGRRAAAPQVTPTTQVGSLVELEQFVQGLPELSSLEVTTAPTDQTVPSSNVHLEGPPWLHVDFVLFRCEQKCERSWTHMGEWETELLDEGIVIDVRTDIDNGFQVVASVGDGRVVNVIVEAGHRDAPPLAELLPGIDVGVVIDWARTIIDTIDWGSDAPATTG
jgi:hypothetical protein